METSKLIERLPRIDLLDDGGYPTDDYLEYIKKYTGEVLPINDFVEYVLQDGWWMPEWGFRLRRKYRGVRKLELHTGGWSGNEDIMEAILGNIHLTRREMQYVMWRTGGHYYFEIPVL